MCVSLSLHVCVCDPQSNTSYCCRLEIYKKIEQKKLGIFGDLITERPPLSTPQPQSPCLATCFQFNLSFHYHCIHINQIFIFIIIYFYISVFFRVVITLEPQVN